MMLFSFTNLQNLQLQLIQSTFDLNKNIHVYKEYVLSHNYIFLQCPGWSFLIPWTNAITENPPTFIPCNPTIYTSFLFILMCKFNKASVLCVPAPVSSNLFAVSFVCIGICVCASVHKGSRLRYAFADLTNRNVWGCS